MLSLCSREELLGDSGVSLSYSIKRLLGFSPVRYASRVLVAQISQSLRLQAVSLVSQTLGVLTVVLYFRATAGEALLYSWAIVSLLAIWAGAIFRRQFRGDTARERHVRRWLRAWMAVTVLSGLVWGFAGVAFLTATSTMDEVVLVTVIVAIVFASWPVHSCWLPSLSVFTLLSLSPVFFGVAAAHGIGHFVTCASLIVIMCFVLYSGRRLNEIVVLSVIRNAQNERLVTRLKAEKALSDTARKATAAATAMRTHFFAGANHDLRQPLQALGIYLQILKGSLKGQDLEALGQIEVCANNISTLVEQILEVSRIESGQIAVSVEEIAIPELFSELASEFSVLCKEKGLQFSFVDLPLKVRSDRTLLERILRNFLTNAVRYTTSRVELLARDAGEGRVTLSVKDDGPGIATEEKEKIFDAFFRGKTGKERSHGYGLGLSIVQGLASRLSVPISVESELGVGSEFSLTLLSEDLDAGAASQERANAENALAPITGTIALLEDNEIVREALIAILKSFGAEVIASATPESDFVERVIRNAQADNLTAIVSDFNLGDGFPNGLETIYFVTSSVKKPVPSILLTAVSEEIINEAYGALDGKEKNPAFRKPLLLQKPVSAKSLSHALNTVIAKVR